MGSVIIWLHMVTGYSWLKWYTYRYSGLHMVMVGYIWLQWFTYDYS